MKLIVTVDYKNDKSFEYVSTSTKKENTMAEVWKGVQKQLEEKGCKIITLSVEEYEEE